MGPERKKCLLACAQEGGKICPPLMFFNDKPKAAGRGAAKFSVPAYNKQDALCESFNFLSGQVRSPGQVNVPGRQMTDRNFATAP